MSKLNLVILGGGNGPHCYAGIAASQPDVEVRVLTLSMAERWANALEEGPLKVKFVNWKPDEDKVFTGKPRIVSKDPAAVIPGAHLIVFMVPACVHERYFTAIEPYMDEHAIICGVPGGSGFLFQAQNILGSKLTNLCLMSFESLPWICRWTEFGREAIVRTGKDVMRGGAMGDLARVTALGMNPVEALEHTLLTRPRMIVEGHLIGDTLMYANAHVHPCVQYGAWSEWNGEGFDEPMGFYSTVSESTANLIAESSHEMLKIRDAILKKRPDINLSQAIHIHESYCKTHPDCDIPDKTSMYTIFHSHKGYKSVKHPMVKRADGKYIPDFEHRFLTEDIPCGQVVLKGIALILGVKTPVFDKIIYWAQAKMGKEYLVGGELIGKDIGETRCPQRFGITTLDGLVG